MHRIIRIKAYEAEHGPLEEESKRGRSVRYIRY